MGAASSLELQLQESNGLVWLALDSGVGQRLSMASAHPEARGAEGNGVLLSPRRPEVAARAGRQMGGLLHCLCWGGAHRHPSGVEVEDSARTQYTVQAASFKTPDVWCNSPRANVFVGSWSDIWAEQKMLCKNPSGVMTNGRYYLAIFLADVMAHHM